MPPDCDASDIDRAIAHLRAGKSAQVGGGRCFATHGFRNGRPVMTTSDDGYTEEVPITEERLREIVASERSLFVDYLRIWER